MTFYERHRRHEEYCATRHSREGIHAAQHFTKEDTDAEDFRALRHLKLKFVLQRISQRGNGASEQFHMGRHFDLSNSLWNDICRISK